MARPKLGELLLDLGYITEDQLKAALEEQERTGDLLGQILLRRGYIREEDLVRALADQQRAPLIHPAQTPLDPQALRLLDPRFAREKRVLPFKVEGNRLHVAMAHPSDLALLDELRFRTGKEIVPYLAPDREILEVLDRLLAEEARPREEARAREEAEAVDLTLEAMPAVRLAQALLERAIALSASDLHLDPQETHLQVRARIDGVMQDLERLPKDLEAPLAARYKVLAGMDIAERRRPQDGHFTFSFEGRRYEVRVASVGTLHGEKLTLRIIYPTGVRLGLTELGMLPEELDRFQKLLKRPYGILFVTGPTGSGKTTTLYAALEQLYTKEKTFVTIEDPVEFPLEGVVQIPVQPKIGLTFAEALRTVLRLDPDVILVGEVRDAETLDTALRAALTGHLVLATLHANDAVAALTRLVEMGAERPLLAATLIGTVAQRLVRRVCPQCAKPMPVPEEARLYLGERAPEVEKRGMGCPYCRGTGYRGRIGVYEVYAPDREALSRFAQGAGEEALRERARALGHRDLWEVGLLQVRAGMTTTGELLRVLGLWE
ncbi:type II secretion system protein E [Thermus thermophilus]|uniref:Type II secretion system protein E n=1 Tax=Thermus thermophilus TaxID=274 RepID=A0AAD1NX79_THETH|nr:GspE/PulE family protein [Thermus thermophilus]BBL81469.1 type II secretion system protein E [Thermus thermophilus]BBL83772.1 type II secretion system protein E [Thermus thermophilus]BCZ86076.1 type II secretion system protein E [Thermus thermophilus]BCZ88452.1 type II secretion system protein E [Thermus thermophilus]BCZ91087.1 type II secretion system protein E [Thermus thermophilus]